MFADLENELDGLDSDEDEGPTPPVSIFPLEKY